MAKELLSYVLLVEDEQQIVEVWAVILEREGYNVVCAYDGADALRVLQMQTGLPALILTDLMMPRMSGFEFCRRIAAIPTFADVPVVIVSSVVELSDLPPSGNIKAAFSKSIGVEKLLACVATWGSTARTNG